MSSRLIPLAFLLAALLAPVAASAATEKEACAGPRLGATDAFRARFPELLEQARAELPNTKGVDACARVDLQVTDDGIVLQVLLPDGRETARGVTRPEDVLPTLQALLLVPEREQPAPVPARVARTTRAPSVVAAARPLLARERDASPAATLEPSGSGFELSVVSGVRVGDGQYGYGGGVLSFIQLSRWLIGFQGRADGYRSLLGSDPETALTLGVLLGRRFHLGGTSLDVAAGPALALRGATFGESETVSMAVEQPRSPTAPTTTFRPPPENEIGPVPRLLLGLRWGFSPRSVFRTFIGVDGELGPRRSDVAPYGFDDAGRMPAYTVGLSLGATVGTR